MRVVFDTNVLIAAFIARGACADLLKHCVLRHEIVLSEPILDELKEQLLGKFRIGEKEVDEAVTLLRTRMGIVAPQSLSQPVCRDADDDVVLATAAAGQAVCIVTGDKDLLVLQRYLNVAIVSPSQFAAFEAT